MGMFSEAAKEGVVQAVVVEIKKELSANSSKPEVCQVLKKIGRFALTQFEWVAPDWAGEYEKLFKE